jgi:hypothetical protein
VILKLALPGERREAATTAGPPDTATAEPWAAADPYLDAGAATAHEPAPLPDPGAAPSHEPAPLPDPGAAPDQEPALVPDAGAALDDQPATPPDAGAAPGHEPATPPDAGAAFEYQTDVLQEGRPPDEAGSGPEPGAGGDGGSR